jgi:heme exporter protein A
MEGCCYQVKTVSITAKNVSKDFNRRAILRDMSFELSSPASLAITGKNGTGKSTLSKILAGLLMPTKGIVEYRVDGTAMPVDDFKHFVGFVSPYLNLYDEFTALENLQLLSRIRSNNIDLNRIQELLTLVNLWHRRDDVVGTFSSGMKQRLKYAFALLHRPAVLLLDEPTSNLDDDGIQVVKQIVTEQKKNGLLIIATNDETEANWCEQQINVGVKQGGSQ